MTARIRPEIILLACGAAVFARTLFHPFFLVDDTSYVTQNPMVRMGVTAEGLHWSLNSLFFGYFAPLLWFSHALDISAFGMWAGGHHLTSILLHSAAAIFLFRALLLMTGDSAKSLCVALLFLLHPQQVEAVAWISSRKDVLCGFFATGTLLAYAHYARAPGLARYLLIAVCFLCGLCSKTAIAVLPALFILLDFWPLRRAERGMRFCARRTAALVAEKLPLAALAIPFVVLSYKAQLQLGALDVVDAGGFSDRVLRVATHYGLYIGNFFYPLRLGFPYPRPELAAAESALMLALLAAITALAFLWRRVQGLLVGWLWFLVALFPFAQWQPVGLQSVADRWMYVPLIGLGILCVWGGAAALLHFGISGRGRQATAALLLACAGLLSFIQAGFWQDAEGMLKRMICLYRNHPVAYTYLANLSLAPGAVPRTLALIERSLSQDPDFIPAFERMVLLRTDMKDSDSLRARIPTRPEHAASFREHLAAAAKLESLGGAFVTLEPAAASELYEQARAAFARARELRPQSGAAAAGYARMLWALGRRDEAISGMRAALLLRGGGATMQGQLAAYLLEQGDVAGAIEGYRKAIQANPTLAEAYIELASALTAEQSFGEALHVVRTLLIVQPVHGKARLREADLLLRLGRAREALHILDGLIARNQETEQAQRGREAALKALQYRRE